jgi:GNAT superfamily N-acetyltransferase
MPVVRLAHELESELAEQFPDIQIKSGIRTYTTRYLRPGTQYRTFVAQAKGQIIGYLIGRPSSGSPDVDELYGSHFGLIRRKLPAFYIQITFVSRPYRHRGVSRALHEKAVDFARKEGYKEIYACIANWNHPELAVIECCGFARKDLGHRFRLSLKL